MRVGIDPGKSGAIALLDGSLKRVIEVLDMPETLEEMRAAMLFYETSIQVNIEEQAAFARGDRRMGASSAFTTGKGFGALWGLAVGLGHPVHIVRPQVWKRRAGLIGMTKEDSRQLAIKMFPEVAHRMTRKKDHGRAEAILIARYGG